jgi:hypothetical protein
MPRIGPSDVPPPQIDPARRAAAWRWNFPEPDVPWDRFTGAIGILKPTFFVPEPSRWLTLGAGLSLLAVL